MTTNLVSRSLMTVMTFIEVKDQQRSNVVSNSNMYGTFGQMYGNTN